MDQIFVKANLSIFINIFNVSTTDLVIRFLNIYSKEILEEMCKDMSTDLYSDVEKYWNEFNVYQ